MTQRWALGVEYDGSAFNGWQTQPDRNTLQDVLEAALTDMAGHSVATICAGRTDAGVHAKAQVVHFDTPADRPQQAWVRGVNAALPAGIAVRWAKPVPESFHARFSALARRYTYRILNDPVRSPLLRLSTTWVLQPLDVAAMTAASRLLIGTHDYSSFRSSQCQAKNPVRTVSDFSLTCEGPIITLEIEANAFLHHMVRNLVGLLVQIGMGRQPVRWAHEVLAAKDRRVGAPTLGPEGLCLSGVSYDAAFELPTRAVLRERGAAQFL